MLSKEEKKAVIDLFPFMGENPMVFDIGSNKCHWSDIIIEEYKDKASIHLFEPVEILLNFSKIKYEYQKNVFYNQIAASNKSNQATNLYYFENFNNELSSLYKGGKEWDGLPMKEKKVQTITIDEYCNKSGIEEVDYIKIDCEGGDVDVLEGCKRLLADDKVKIIQIEYSEHYKRANRIFQDIVNIINATGHKIYRYIDDNFWEVKEENPPFDNYFITKLEIHNYSVGGWNNDFILSTADLPKMNLVGEVGIFEGLTTKYICENLLEQCGRVVAVDPLYDYYVTNDPRYHPEFRHQYQRFLRNTRGLPIDLKRGESKDELPKLNALRMDMWFIDGNHYPDWPYFDGCWCFAMTKVGGYLLFDDYNLWAEDTKASIDKFLNEFQGYYEILKSNYQILIRKTRNNYNSITSDWYK